MEKIKRFISKKDLVITLIVGSIGCLIMAFMYALSQFQERPFSELSRDMLSVLGGRIGTGLLSNVGIILWGVAFSLLACGWFIRTMNKEKGAGTILALGLITLLLYLDDFLMIHEFVIRDILGLPEESMMVLYFVVVLMIMGMKWKFLWPEGLKFLILGFLFLGGSAGLDTVYKYVYIPNIHIFEDGSKLLGICFWTMFSIVVFTQSFEVRGKRNMWYGRD